MTMVPCHIPLFCSSSSNISNGYWILKIIYSVTKDLIKHPVVYFLSSESTLNNSSDINVIRQIIQFYCGTIFLNTLCNHLAEEERTGCVPSLSSCCRVDASVLFLYLAVPLVCGWYVIVASNLLFCYLTSCVNGKHCKPNQTAPRISLIRVYDVW